MQLWNSITTCKKYNSLYIRMQKTFHIYESFQLGFVVSCFCGGGICFCSFTGVLRSPWASILPNLKKRLTALLITCLSQWLAMFCSCSVWPLHFYCWKLHWSLGMAEHAFCQVHNSPKPPGFSVFTWSGNFWCSS